MSCSDFRDSISEKNAVFFGSSLSEERKARLRRRAFGSVLLSCSRGAILASRALRSYKLADQSWLTQARRHARMLVCRQSRRTSSRHPPASTHVVGRLHFLLLQPRVKSERASRGVARRRHRPSTVGTPADSAMAKAACSRPHPSSADRARSLSTRAPTMTFIMVLSTFALRQQNGLRNLLLLPCA